MARLRDQLLSTYLTEAVNAVSGVAFGIIAARALEPAGRGAVAAAWAAVTISATISGLGLSKSLVSRLNDRSLEFNAADYYGAIALYLPVAILIGWAILIPMLPSFPGEASVAIAVAALGVPVIFVSDITRSILRARRRIYAINATTASAAALRVTVMIGLWYSGHITIVTVLLIEIGFHALIGSVGCMVLRGAILRCPRWTLAIPALRSMLSYGIIFLVFSSLFNFVGRSNIIFLEKTSTAAEAGYFAIALRLVEYLGTQTNQVAFVLLPYLAQMSDHGAQAHRTAAITRLSVLIMVPAAVVLGFACSYIIPLMYGSPFNPAIVPCQILLPGIVAATMFQMSGLAAAASGKLRTLTMSAGVGFGVNAVCMFMLVAPYGADGAAISFTIGHLSSLVVFTVATWISSGLSPIEIFVPKRSDAAAMLRALRFSSKPNSSSSC